MSQNLNRFFRIYLRLAALTLVVCTLLRIVLLFNEQTSELGFGFLQWVAVFGLGALNDLCALTLGYVFLRLFVPRLQPLWSKGWLAALLAIYVSAILFNAVSEYYFWNEFGVRYNFIAVDYLVYTNEVVGNIMESYPIVPLATLIVALTVAVTWWLFRRDIRAAEAFKTGGWKLVASPIYLAMAGVALWMLPFNTRFQTSDNVYYNELQANGLYKFYEAFLKNELDYMQFYRTLPEDRAAALVHDEYRSEGQNHRYITSPNEERHPNIVLVTLESMSASFMARYGSSDGLTPRLDSLCGKALVFDRLFATGNRTVRGLEAVTLSLPPCPGQSIIKRPRNAGMHSTGAMLRDKGYDVLYFYGGNSYFDNMETFFGGNGYEIVDQKQYAPDEITFQNIWGVSDEDSYAKAIRTLGQRARSGRPFFAHIMSVSNHRPYTYPAGRIPIPNDAKSRAGGVMYSDYALGGFLDAASREPWFDNTVFVITADHCASSAGKTEIPLEKYHIPAMIYAPAFVASGSVGKTASQIDLMPTLFSLLGMDYDSWFYGRDILADDFRERAFVATYQDLGYLEGDRFTVLSPVDRAEQFLLRPTDDDPYAWGLSATVGYGFAIWGVRIYQNQTVELGGQLLVVLMQAFVLPALLYGADRLRRRLSADATALFGGLLFAQIPRLAASAGSAWLYAWLLPLGNGSVSPLQETMRAGGSAVLGSVTVLCGIWSMIWGWQAFCRATHAKGLRSIAVYAGCYVLAAILLAIILQTLRHGWHLNW